MLWGKALSRAEAVQKGREVGRICRKEAKEGRRTSSEEKSCEKAASEELTNSAQAGENCMHQEGEKAGLAEKALEERLGSMQRDREVRNLRPEEMVNAWLEGERGT